MLHRPSPRRPLSRGRRGIGAAVATALLGITALAGCGAKTPSQGELTQALIDSGLSRQTSACASKAIVGSLSHEQLQTLVERGLGGAPTDDPDRTDDAADKLRDALAKCREANAASTTTTTLAPGVVTTTVPTSAPDDAEFNTTDPADGTGASTTTIPADGTGASSTTVP